MYVPRRQRGVSFLGWVAILLLAGGAAYVGIQIGPPYANYLTLVQVVEGVHEDSALRRAPMPEISRALNTRLGLNEVDRLDKRRLKARDVIDIRRPGGRLVFMIDYSIERHLAGNLYLLLKFNKQIGP